MSQRLGRACLRQLQLDYGLRTPFRALDDELGCNSKVTGARW